MKRLRTLRQEANLSQLEFAKKMGISKGAVGHWEAGSREPNLETVRKIANFFKVTMDYLLGISDFRQEREAVDYLLKKLKVSGLVKPNDTIDKKTVDALMSYISVLTKIRATN